MKQNKKKFKKFKAVADALNLATTSLEWTPTIALGSRTWIPWLPHCLCPVVRYFECVFLFTSIQGGPVPNKVKMTDCFAKCSSRIAAQP